jgi:hypothetical protein
MAKDKWVKRWKVPKSNGDGDWIVAIDGDGNYGCSCPVWKFKRQECHHIRLVKLGLVSAEESKARPEYLLAKVNKPTFDPGRNRLLIPLVGIPDAMMMEATICYYLLKHGYSMGEIRELRHIPRDWTAKAIFDHIARHGEAEYPDGWYEH